MNMTALDRLSTVFLVAIFLFAKTSGFASCPDDAVVDLTDLGPDQSGSVNDSGVVFPPESTWSENGRTFGCLCDFKWCVPMCCSLEQAMNEEGSCLVDNLTLAGLTLESSTEYFDLSNSNPCNDIEQDLVLRTSHYDHLEDGSIQIREIPWPVDFGSYCFFREPETTSLSALACPNIGTTEGTIIWSSICLTVATFFMLTTLIVYCVIPELKNLQGWIVRSYLASYVCCLILFMADDYSLRNGWDQNIYVSLLMGIMWQIHFLDTW